MDILCRICNSFCRECDVYEYHRVFNGYRACICNRCVELSEYFNVTLKSNKCETNYAQILLNYVKYKINVFPVIIEEHEKQYGKSDELTQMFKTSTADNLIKTKLTKIEDSIKCLKDSISELREILEIPETEALHNIDKQRDIIKKLADTEVNDYNEYTVLRDKLMKEKLKLRYYEGSIMDRKELVAKEKELKDNLKEAIESYNFIEYNYGTAYNC